MTVKSLEPVLPWEELRKSPAADCTGGQVFFPNGTVETDEVPKEVFKDYGLYLENCARFSAKR